MFCALSPSVFSPPLFVLEFHEPLSHPVSALLITRFARLSSRVPLSPLFFFFFFILSFFDELALPERILPSSLTFLYSVWCSLFSPTFSSLTVFRLGPLYFSPLFRALVACFGVLNNHSFPLVSFPMRSARHEGLSPLAGSRRDLPIRPLLANVVFV